MLPHRHAYLYSRHRRRLGGGWYLDGRLLIEGHRVTAERLMSALGMSMRSVELDSDLAGYLPKNLSELSGVPPIGA